MRVRSKTARRRAEAARRRVILLIACFMMGFSVISLRLMGFAATDPVPRAERAEAEPLPARGDILDRRGRTLATDVTTYLAFADPRRISFPERTIAQIKTVLPDIDEKTLLARLTSDRHWVPVARRLTPQQRYDLFNLGLAGVGFEQERRRFYPHGALTAHILGYTNTQGEGLEGIELAFEDRLSALANGQPTEDTPEPLTLSIDLRVQHALVDELGRAKTTFSAKGAAGIVMDALTGEIVALASLPDFDPHSPGRAADLAKFNRAVTGVYEPGSTLKAFTIAMALDSGAVSLKDGYDASRPIRFGRFTINDFHPENRWLSVPEIFYHSSNIGTAKMALDVGIPTQQAYLARFGLTSPADVELTGAQRPIVPKRWGELEAMTISFGHGIAVSPVQLAAATAALVNGGCLIKPTILRKAPGDREECNRVIKSETSAIMRGLFRQVVEEGTGRKAGVEGYGVGGKTGTAEKAVAGGYAEKRLVSSFLGVFPAQDPQFVVYVMLDEPQGTEETHGFATGGWVAAPVVSRVVRRMGSLVALAPQSEEGEALVRPAAWRNGRRWR